MDAAVLARVNCDSGLHITSDEKSEPRKQSVMLLASRKPSSYSVDLPAMYDDGSDGALASLGEGLCATSQRVGSTG